MQIIILNTIYMNKLLYSSIVMSILIICVSLIFYVPELKPLYLYTYVGLITSILNHGYNNEFYRQLDRGVMLFLSGLYIYYGLLIKNHMLKFFTVVMVVLLMFMYVLSKYVFFYTNDATDLARNIHVFVHFSSIVPFALITINSYYNQ